MRLARRHTCHGAATALSNAQPEHGFISLKCQALGGRQLAPMILHISVEATNQAWITALSFMSTLEELIIESAGPSSLGAKVFRSLIVWPTHRGRRAPLCPSLKRLRLKYRRWLRQTERFNVIPDLMFAIKSRERSNYALESLNICMTSNQEDPLELIEESRMSQEGLQRLANMSGITGERFSELVTTGLVQAALKSGMGLSKTNI